MRPIKDILVAPVMSEKSSGLRFSENNYVFKVSTSTNKIEIKRAVEKRFNVIVDEVRTVNVRGKMKNVRGVAGRASSWKKAYIKVHQGQSISEFEGA